MITVECTGEFKSLNSILERVKSIFDASKLDKYGEMGVEALKAATPVDTGLAASSWYYFINRTSTGCEIVWANDDIENGYNVAIIVDQGHATKRGAYVPPRNFIAPAIKATLDKIAMDINEGVL